jgi:glycosyltransferase involved in cell wall biosynthesis
MRVGLLVYGLDRPLSGIGRYTVELARALGELASVPEMVLLAAGATGPLRSDEGWEIHSLPGCRRLPGLMTLGNLTIPSRVRQQHLDLVHDPTGVTPLLCGAGGARSVVTVHDVFAWSCPGNSTRLDMLVYHYWLPHVLPRVEAVITVSHASKRDIMRYLRVPAAKIHVILEGVNRRFCRPTEAVERDVQKRHGLPTNYILFVGSVEKRKNLSHLLKAYDRLWQMGERRRLVIVGARRWLYSDIAETVTQLQMKDRPIFTGYVPDEDLPALYGGADLFVFPSVYEGFGLPPLEAMACGTPVVCSNTSSLPEVVGAAAVTVDPCDVEALAEAMRRVLADADLREELRARGLARAAQFTWEKTARETFALYEEVMRRSN